MRPFSFTISFVKNYESSYDHTEENLAFTESWNVDPKNATRQPQWGNKNHSSDFRISLSDLRKMRPILLFAPEEANPTPGSYS
jgi:hypothetical protein